MDDMARVVHHDVTVVSILELKQVGYNRVGSHTFDKVGTCLLESNGVFAPVLGHEIIIQTVDGFTTEHVTGNRVGEHINHTTARRSGGNPVRIDPNVQTNAGEDASEGSYQLQGKHVLAAVVAHLKDRRLPNLIGLLFRLRTVGQLALVSVVVIISVNLGPFNQSWSGLLDSECGHVWCLCMALQGLTGLAVNTHDHAIRVTRKINANLNLDLPQFFFNLLLLFRLASLDIRAKFARYACDLIEERKFLLVESTLLVREARYQVFQEAIKSSLEGIRL